MSPRKDSRDGGIRRLYLWRHAKAVHGDMADFERPLTERGRHDAELVAGWLTGQEIEPDEVLCSPSRRTTETWKAFRRRLRREPEAHLPDSLYRAAAWQLLDHIRSVEPGVGSLLLVGHNPGMEELAVDLSGPGSDAGELAELQLKFLHRGGGDAARSRSGLERTGEGEGQARAAAATARPPLSTGHGGHVDRRARAMQPHAH